MRRSWQWRTAATCGPCAKGRTGSLVCPTIQLRPDLIQCAWMGHKDPPPGKVGFMYMLAGGTDASNTDPYASQPTAANHWIKTGPHIMIVGADASFYDSYPKSPDPDTKQPYVMWAGTPYQHLMAPVK